MVVAVCASLSSSSSAAFLRSSRPRHSPLPAFLYSFRSPDSTHRNEVREGERVGGLEGRLPPSSVDDPTTRGDDGGDDDSGEKVTYGRLQLVAGCGIGVERSHERIGAVESSESVSITVESKEEDNVTGELRSLETYVQNPTSSVSINQLESQFPTTGGAYDFKGATISISDEILSSPKMVTLVRHGLSSWNEENRVQGSSNLSILTEVGARQAEKCRSALTNISFDICFSSPISRAKSTAELIWHGREKPLIFLDSLKEAHLFFLEGMTNADAKKKYPELYTAWREDPFNFNVDGIYPVRKLWGTAKQAWKDILSTPGESILVITHKSILRALICTALGLGPERQVATTVFRAIDVNNGGISVFTFNRRGEAMLQSLNMTAHMYSSHIYQY
ncbi:hypothetical protein ZIOFF_013976 [Zingiber officinale]|uniref:2-carboxy-D-arabinitol-1-phosphatase n=1 Tax=Zingiber officinale TaxID=94328 RepID=A0A8J5LUV6_ZINOF|nr:hypothetical protein ZIOFF_013976 [Zingiber officinale]